MDQPAQPQKEQGTSSIQPAHNGPGAAANRLPADLAGSALWDTVNQALLPQRTTVLHTTTHACHTAQGSSHHWHKVNAVYSLLTHLKSQSQAYASGQKSCSTQGASYTKLSALHEQPLPEVLLGSQTLHLPAAPASRIKSCCITKTS
jgi:hypothetical protein